MSLILTSANLASGSASSSTITGVYGNWRVTATTTGCPTRQGTMIELWVAGDTGDLHPLVDKNGTRVRFPIIGNASKSISVDNVNAASAKVVVVPIDGATGTISIDSVVTNAATGASDAADTIVTSLTDGSQVTQTVDPDGNYIYPSGEPFVIASEITRPANTTAYTALDAMARLAASVAQVETISLSGTAPTLNTWTVTLTGTGGSANITIAGGLTKLATFNASLTQTATDFVTAHAAAYLVQDITLTSSGADLIFESAVYDTPVDAPVAVNVSGDLAGTTDETTPMVIVGEATVTGTGGVNALIAFDTAGAVDLTDTAANFAAAYVAVYASEGIDLTSSGEDIIFTAASAGTSFVAPIVTNTIGDLDGTVEHTVANDNPDVLEFQNMSTKIGGGGYLMDVKIESDIVAIAGTTVRVWVYDDTPSAIIPDNAAFNHVYADRNARLFYVDVVMDAQDGASASIIGQASVIKEYTCASTSLFAQVQTIEGFTPTSGGKVNVTFNVLKLS